MKTQLKNHVTYVLFILVSISLTVFSSLAIGDDLTPPAYRGDPLSVHAHYLGDATGSSNLNLTAFSWVDDGDPATTLYPVPATDPVDLIQGLYNFEIPNVIDELPIKFLRLQLTWVGTTQPPLSVKSNGLNGPDPVIGQIVFASTPLVFTQPDGGYQYFDIEYKPNPDFERITVELAADATLVQTVIDSVSTVPEPATLVLLAFGSLAMFKTKR